MALDCQFYRKEVRCLLSYVSEGMGDVIPSSATAHCCLPHCRVDVHGKENSGLLEKVMNMCIWTNKS